MGGETAEVKRTVRLLLVSEHGKLQLVPLQPPAPGLDSSTWLFPRPQLGSATTSKHAHTAVLRTEAELLAQTA